MFVKLTTYTFFSTGETRPIKFNLTCETKNLIYMIQCNRCNLQYIGETKRRLKDRFTTTLTTSSRTLQPLPAPYKRLLNRKQ